MRDLPLNEKQQKDGCFTLTFLLIFFILGLALLHFVVNDSLIGAVEYIAGFVITLALLYFIDKKLIK